MERESFKGPYPYYGAQGVIDHVRDYRCDGEYMLIAEDGENLVSRNEPIALIAKGKFWVNNHAHIVRTNDAADMVFTCYALNHLDIAGYITGSAQPKLSQGNLNKIKVLFPTIDYQKKISQRIILYDNLIDTNNKRIRVLEQMAENLYKEWFIRFRYPGHETDVFEDGIPRGWQRGILSDISDIVMGQSPESQYYNQEGIGLPFHQGVGSYGDYFLNDEIYSTEGNRIAEPGTIIFSVRAPVGRINISLNRIILGRGVAGINSKINQNGYLFWMLKNAFSIEDSIGNGSIFSSVKKEELAKFKILIPPVDLMKRFDTIAMQIEQQMSNYHSSICNLLKQKALLLPRLISGKSEI